MSLLRLRSPLHSKTIYPDSDEIIYPDSDGEPMAENPLQFQWIVTIKEGLEHVFIERPNVYVAGDMFWYPVEGQPKICQAPDAMVAFGRPKGYRGSYMQWKEEGIPPQVVFEVLSPSNRPEPMLQKFKFYEKYGVEEYYIFDPFKVELTGFRRIGDELTAILEMNGWTSPRLGVRFQISEGELTIYGPDGRRFLTFQEHALRGDQLDQVAHERDRVAHERDRVAHERDQIAHERDRVAHERDQVAHERDAECRRVERLAAQLRALGIEPSTSD